MPECVAGEEIGCMHLCRTVCGRVSVLCSVCQLVGRRILESPTPF